MIDFQFFVTLTACFAAAVLLVPHALDVVRSIGTAILGFSCSSILLVRRVIGPVVVAVIVPPSSQRRRYLLRVLLGPPLHLSTVASWIFGPAASSSGSLKPRSCSKPSFGPLSRAANADAIRHEPLVLMTVLARRARRVVAQTFGAGCYPVLVLRTFSLARHRVLNGARSAVPTDCVPFRQVTVPAWFAGTVEALACRLRGLSLWNSVHRSPTLSATFTVVQAA